MIRKEYMKAMQRLNNMKARMDEFSIGDNFDYTILEYQKYIDASKKGVEVPEEIFERIAKKVSKLIQKVDLEEE